MKKLFIIVFLIVFSCSKDEPPIYLLSVSASIGGSVSSTGGEYAEGKSLTITATSNSEYQFVNWSNGSTQNPITITLMADQVLMANFTKVKYGLTLLTEGEGTISEELISSGRTSEYNSGSLVRLTATPAIGYSFTGWTGDLTSTDNPLEVDINSAKSITAVFDLISVSLQVEIEGEGEVLEQVVISGRSTDYNYGDTVELTPQPSEGFDFISWSGDHTGEENPLQLTLTESKTVQANFEYELFNRVIGKWKIRKKTEDKLSWYLHSITFRKNYSYTLNSNIGQVNGVFDVLSNAEIELVGSGRISNVDLTQSGEGSSTFWSNFNFNITIPGEFEGNVESDVVENYQSEVSETGEIIEKTYVPDDNFEQTLINLGYDDVMDDYVITSSISQVEELKNEEWAGTISDLTGIEDFISLTSLQLDNMELSELDVSNNIYLTTLSVVSNKLKELNIENNTSLFELIINKNNISSIDLSNNASLTNLIISENDLTSIDLTNNTLLERATLGDIGLSSIDLTNNTNLKYLYLSGNQLSSLNVSNNLLIEELYLSNNQISSLDFINNTKLKFLDLKNLQLTSLDLYNQSDLDYLNIQTNQFYSIDLSNNSLISTLLANENPNLLCIKVDPDLLTNIPSAWSKDDKADYLIECLDCSPEINLSGGELTQTTTLGTPISPIEIILSSACSDTTYNFSYENNSVPGLIVSFEDNIINLRGAPSLEGTYDYSILVESTNLIYNQSSSTLLVGTINSNAPTLTATLTTGSENQTVSLSSAINEVKYLFSTNYTGPLNAVANNLPPGVSMTFSNYVATLSGTATTSGTYNYSIDVSAGSTNSSINGTIVVNPCKSNINSSEFNLVGHATLSGNTVTLTPNTGNKGGMIWSKNKINLDEDFSVEVDLYLGTKNGNGGDGMGFVFQGISDDQNGWTEGSSLGFGSISESMAIEFDTYRGGGDPTTNDHIAIIKDGAWSSTAGHSAYASYVDVGNIEDGNNHRTIIKWVASTNKLSVTFDGNVIIDVTLNIKDVFFDGDPQVYWGFTAATGGLSNLQKVTLIEYCY